MLDFDKLFEAHLVNYFNENEDKFSSVAEFEAEVPNIYLEWSQSPSDALGGLTPHSFFENIEKPEELLSILIGTSGNETNPCSLLLDRIVCVKECVSGLFDILNGEYLEKQKTIAAQLLVEMDAVKNASQEEKDFIGELLESEEV
ncbi:MAG: hypothetical protein FWC11_00845 [Firmicutes bacterium]|nr:hypothetical protein [Bacillota bacterium]MCL2255389.1 hypothetical protein [Bacillota bacterium]